jgi:hypothetical protein
MNFGPAEMAQMMAESQALIRVMFVSAVGIGIVLGLLIALYRIFFGHRAADQSFQSGMSTDPVLATIPVRPTVAAQEIDATAPRSPRRVPPANNLVKPLKLIGTVILIVVGGAGGMPRILLK